MSTGASLADKVRIAQRLLTVGALHAWEQARGKKAYTAADVPGSAYAITPEWCTAVLCGGVPGARVLECSVTGGSSGTSERRALALVLNDAAREAGIPERVFTKSTTSYRQRLTLGFAGIISGEVGFYPQIRPQLDIEAPRGYFACLDERSWRSMVVMEDIVHTRGARFISTETCVSRVMIENLLDNMARWHGFFWNSAQFGAGLRWLRTPGDWLDAVNRFIAHQDRCRHGVSIAQPVIRPELLDHTDALFAAMMQCQEQSRSLPQTFLHGDPHIGQTYITADGNIGYGDWQIIMRGHWAYDYTYALVSALTVADRRAWEEELLRFYLDRLRAHGGDAPAFDAAWLAYRRNAIYPYFCWLSTIPGADNGTTPDMQPRQVSLDIIERSANAIADLDSLAAVRT